jgi:hypothetical protein
MATLERADAAIAAGEAPLIDAAPGTGAMLAEFRHTRAATVAQLEALPEEGVAEWQQIWPGGSVPQAA